MKKVLFIVIPILLFGCKTVKVTTYLGNNPVEFVGDTVFHTTFKTLDGFRIYDNDFYNDNDVWFSEDAIELTEEGLILKCYKDTCSHESWNGSRITSWTAGAIDTKPIFKYPYGTWIVVAKTDKSMSAIWMLKDEHFVEGYEKHKIIPEIDLMEIVHDKFKSTIHWGYMDDGYRRYDDGYYVQPWDGNWHEYAVVLLEDGYDFYFDKRKVCSLRSKNKEFVSDASNFLILNNACDSTMCEENYNMYIKSITVLK